MRAMFGTHLLRVLGFLLCPGMWGGGEEPTTGKEGTFYECFSPGPNMSGEISRPASGHSFTFKLLTTGSWRGRVSGGGVSLDPASRGLAFSA